MSGAGAMDLRVPIGGLFVALGLILAGYGLMTAGDTEMYRRTFGTNLNLWWGLVMLATGLIFLALARRGARRGARRPLADSAAGAATEAREKGEGLER
jgi:hypothetical protein